MDFYTNACEQLESAKILAAANKYRVAVTLLCLAGELFLKSMVERKDPNNPYLSTHDIIGLGRTIKDEIEYSKISPHLKFLRKYLNDSRYPFDVKVYTQAFYGECLESITTIQQALDAANAEKSDIQLLRERFGDKKVIDKRK